MPNTRSAKKRMRQNMKRRIQNKSVRARTRTQVKKARAALAEGELSEAQEAVRQAASELDRAVRKGVIHRNKSNRQKSRLMKRLAELGKSGE